MASLVWIAVFARSASRSSLPTVRRWFVVPFAVAAPRCRARKQRLPKRVTGFGRPERRAEVQVGESIFRQAHRVTERLNHVLVQARRPNAIISIENKHIWKESK